MAKPPVAWFLLLLSLSPILSPCYIFLAYLHGRERGLGSSLRGRLLGLGRRGDGAGSGRRRAYREAAEMRRRRRRRQRRSLLLLRSCCCGHCSSRCAERAAAGDAAAGGHDDGVLHLQEETSEENKGLLPEKRNPPPRRTSTKANASQQNRIEPSLNEKERDKKKLPVFKCASPWPASRRPRPGQSPAGPSGASTLARTCGAATKSRKTAAIGEG